MKGRKFKIGHVKYYYEEAKDRFFKEIFFRYKSEISEGQSYKYKLIGPYSIPDNVIISVLKSNGTEVLERSLEFLSDYFGTCPDESDVECSGDVELNIIDDDAYII